MAMGIAFVVLGVLESPEQPFEGWLPSPPSGTGVFAKQTMAPAGEGPDIITLCGVTPFEPYGLYMYF